MQPRPSVTYPCRDGRPVAETDTHRRIMRDLVYGLRQHFRSRNDVCVAGALFLFYEEGNPKRFVVPDVFVSKDVPREKRENYLMWVEGKPPDVVIEVTSQNTKTEDLVMKKNLYARLGVPEYYLFDPLQEYLPEPMVAFDLRADGYASRSLGVGYSPALDLEFVVEGQSLKLRDPETRQTLSTFKHLPPSQMRVRAALQAAEKARRAAERRADAAEARAAELEVELRTLVSRIQRVGAK
jgi:Uma2 family endonuclease